MILKIKGLEFLYWCTKRLIFEDEGKVKENRDYLDFCSSTFDKGYDFAITPWLHETDYNDVANISSETVVEKLKIKEIINKLI